MSLFNIDDLNLDSTFEGWYIKSNEMIDAINQINVLNVRATTSAGLIETFRGGGVVDLGINPGYGLTFGDAGQLTLDASNNILKSRPSASDRFIVIQNPTSTPSVRVVTASNMLPSQINNDIIFTGNISFSGDLSFITTGTVTLEANTQFEDKQLELAAKFRDVLVFATTATVVVGASAFFYDKDIIGTTIAQGRVSAIDTSQNEVQLSNVIFTPTSDSWTNYTDAGATSGGDYVLFTSSGATIGRGLISRTQTLEPRSDQTSPMDANDGGIVIITNDPTVPLSGGSAGHKKFTWIYNGSTSAAAWTSSENLEVSDGKYLDVTEIRPTGALVDLTSNTNTTTLEFVSKGDQNDYFRIKHDLSTGARILVFSGNSVGSGAKNILTMVADGTMIAGTTAVAVNLNADLLDGANGATVGGSANLIPITDSTGKIDQTFIQGTLVVNEDITYAGHGFTAGNVIRKLPDGGFTLAMANSAENAEVLGVVERVLNSNKFTLAYFGRVDASIFEPSLGYERYTDSVGGGTVAMSIGSIYYLSAMTAGEVTTSIPVNVGEVRKPIVLATGATSAEVLHYIGVDIFNANDAVFAENLIPVGTIMWFGFPESSNRWDFLTCDGTLYSDGNYPELHSSIKDRFYIKGAVTSGTTTLTIPTSGSDTRGIVAGSWLRITYGSSSETIGQVSGVTATSTLITVTLSATFVGTDSNAKVYGYSNNGYFFVPDLRGRFPLGLGNNGVDSSNTSLGDINDITTSSGTNIGNISFTPVIRAKATADAFIATGHIHDDLYLRLDAANDPMTNDLRLGNNSLINVNQIIFNSDETTSAIFTQGRTIETGAGDIKLFGGQLIVGAGGSINVSGGRISSVGDPISPTDGLNLGYADGRYLKLIGGTLSGTLNLGNNNITNLADPTSNQHAATKAYVDDQLSALNIGVNITSVIPTAIEYSPTGTENIYTNNTGKLIYITYQDQSTLNKVPMLEIRDPANGTWIQVCGGGIAGDSGHGYLVCRSAMIPAGWQYRRVEYEPSGGNPYVPSTTFSSNTTGSAIYRPMMYIFS